MSIYESQLNIWVYIISYFILLLPPISKDSEVFLSLLVDNINKQNYRYILNLDRIDMNRASTASSNLIYQYKYLVIVPIHFIRQSCLFLSTLRDYFNPTHGPLHIAQKLF